MVAAAFVISELRTSALALKFSIPPVRRVGLRTRGGKLPLLGESTVPTLPYGVYPPTAIWAVEISSNSVVMLAWRILLYSSVRSLMN